MRLKNFQAGTMNDAMRMIRDALGDNAVIISTTRMPGGKGVQVTAAVESDQEEPTPYTAEAGAMRQWLDQEMAASHTKVLEKPPTPKAVPKATAQAAPKKPVQPSPPATPADLARILRYHNMPDYLAEQLWQTAKDLEPRSIEQLLLAVLQSHFDFSAVPISADGPAVMLMGPPGVGKTMTAAKMATQAVMNKQQVTVITADTYKAGGVEQLQSFTDILGATLLAVDTPEELSDRLDAIPKNHTVIIDSTGINPYDTQELQALGRFIACHSRIEPLLVTNAGMDVNEAADMASNFAYLGAGKLAVTKIDATRRLGSVLAAAHAGNLAFSHFSRHAGAVEGLEIVKPAKLAALLLYYPTSKA